MELVGDKWVEDTAGEERSATSTSRGERREKAVFSMQANQHSKGVIGNTHPHVQNSELYHHPTITLTSNTGTRNQVP